MTGKLYRALALPAKSMPTPSSFRSIESFQAPGRCPLESRSPGEGWGKREELLCWSFFMPGRQCTVTVGSTGGHQAERYGALANGIR